MRLFYGYLLVEFVYTPIVYYYIAYLLLGVIINYTIITFLSPMLGIVLPNSIIYIYYDVIRFV
jgi:hypothetical protein